MGHHFSPVATAPAETLSGLLHRVFGFAAFRANQEAVCRAATEGRDVLLVMPTGAGKSLCYQLPALARGGTALVISPLIALMEDQASKLATLGLRVARIHSGMDREESRQACRDYLDGSLQFLFVAPERMRVPGFPEMLARRKPSLIAIDEAHCISQWGHDFRPDYRMLGQYLPALRPAPIIALTATATPVVQADIPEQLGMVRPSLFIHGFRRDNLAIEVVEVSKPRRPAFVCELLADPARRPAIIYAPTRKDAEVLAMSLSGLFPSAAYHAGLDPDHRDRVQRAFLSGKLETVVATIAFGMGIDKPDVRTVIHTALPGSLEAYYQEIGRAGRDGGPSRTILMHSYADLRTHGFFFERDYPPVDDLDKIFRLLRPEPQEKEALRAALQLDSEVFDKALEKLTIHGGATLDYAGNATAGGRNWRITYVSQSTQRGAQIGLVTRYVEASQCRMAALVRHFGDTADGHKLCGQCDFCSPERSIAQSFRPATSQEERIAYALLWALRSSGARSLGRLHKDLCPAGEMDRDNFEELVAAMARAGFVELQNASFEKDGKSIAYRNASLTSEGEECRDSTPLGLLLKGGSKVKADRSVPLPKGVPRQKAAKPAAPAPVELSSTQKKVADRLRAWRSAEAKKLGQPAFCVFSDRTLRSLAIDPPATEEDLLTIPGIGPAKAEKFGAEICRICAAG